MSIAFYASSGSNIMLEEDWGLGWPDNNSIEKAMRSHLEHIQRYTPPEPKTQCDGTFWGELINIDILHKTRNRTVPLN